MLEIGFTFFKIVNHFSNIEELCPSLLQALKQFKCFFLSILDTDYEVDIFRNTLIFNIFFHELLH